MRNNMEKKADSQIFKRHNSFVEKASHEGRLFQIVYICLYKSKKLNKFELTVEKKYASMKDALLWCYMPIIYIIAYIIEIEK